MNLITQLTVYELETNQDNVLSVLEARENHLENKFSFKLFSSQEIGLVAAL